MAGFSDWIDRKAVAIGACHHDISMLIVRLIHVVGVFNDADANT
jgi:hypothetical protein